MLFKGNSSRLEYLIEKIQAHKESPSPVPDEKCSVKSSKDGILGGSYSWRSEDDSLTCQRGDGTPSSCATSTSQSFPSETEIDGDLRINIDANSSSGPYSCQFCEKTFPTLSCLKKHEQTHGDQMPYRCSWCARLFKHKRSRDRHVKLHTGDRRYRCSHCEAAFSRSDHLKIHMKTHDNQKPYHCTECSRGYNTAAALTSHMQSHKRPSSRSHYQRSSPPAVSSPDHLSAKIPYLQSPLSLTCMYCRDTFTSMDQLQIHVQVAHENLLPGTSPSSSPTNTPEHRKAKAEDLEDLTCRRCSAKFTKLAALREHLVSAHNDGFSPLTCPLCLKPCPSATSYAEHYVLEHCENSKLSSKSKETNENFYETTKANNLSSETLLCGQCGAALKDFESFRAHLARHLYANQQAAASTINCPKCELKFQDKEDMLIHLTKHFMGQILKRFACEVCDKLFGDSETLQKHLLDAHAHHLYRCGICRDTFDSIVGIQVHFTVKHTQEANTYNCTACWSRDDNKASFRTPGELVDHVRSVHVPESLNNSPGNSVTDMTNGFYRCCFCGIICPTDNELQHHLASHSNCLFRCPICREAFPVEFLLDKHIANVHNLIEQTDVTLTENDRKSSIKRRRSPDFNRNISSPEKKSSTSLSTNIHALYQCELCDRLKFTNEAELKAHKKLVHKTSSHKIQKLPSSFICSYCGDSLRSRLELETHTRMHHAPAEPGKKYKCNICDEILTSGCLLAEHKLQKHCKIQISDICVVCRAVLSCEREFLEHVHKHSIEGLDVREGMMSHVPAHCVICRQTLISEFECQLHAKFHLRSDADVDRDIVNGDNCCICLRAIGEGDRVSLPAKDVSAGELKVCKRCFLRHSQGLPILASPYENCNGMSIKEEEVEEDGNTKDDNDTTCRSYKCPHCSLVFTFRSELEHHIPTHDNEGVSKDTVDSVIVKEEFVANASEDQSNEESNGEGDIETESSEKF